jgi:predicted DNA-binding transcriptional regulator
MSTATTAIQYHVETLQHTQPGWSFLSNHALVMLCLVDNSRMKLKQIAQQVGITERAVQRIIAELEHAGYLERHREGRCNEYQLDLNVPMRHIMTHNIRPSDLLFVKMLSQLESSD